MGTFGVVGVLRASAKKAHARLGVGCGESGWGDCTDNFTTYFNYVLNYVFSKNYVLNYVLRKTLNNYVFNYVFNYVLIK